MTSSTGRSDASANAQKRFAYHRYAADVARARRIAWLATFLWIGVGLLMHLALFPTIGHGSRWLVLGVYFAPTPVHLAVLYLMSREPLPPERVLVVIGAVNFFLSGLALAFVASRTGGITSPYHFVILLNLMVQAVALPRPWLDNVIVGSVNLLICPLGVWLFSHHDATLRDQLANPDDRARFVGILLVLGSGVLLTTWSGHVYWTLQQSAFETRSIGRYKLLRRIGKGGMGEVWRAHDKAIRRDVALKILSADHGKSAAAIARFEREIEATASLEHPHTVRVHDWGVTYDGVWYYAMELLDGLDLTALVERRGRLPAPQVVRLGIQTARAVAEAHRRGIVHRDVKPSNVFAVVADGVVDHVKVLDFGVARLLAPDGTGDDMTQTGAVVGTPGYIAPEVMAGAPAAPSADVWGLGATLFYALTGTRVKDAAGRSAGALAPEVPRVLDELLARALEPDPARRPTTAGDLADELEATGLAAASIPLHVDATTSQVSGTDETVDAAGDHRETRADAPAARDRRVPS